jgi:hypothetical protein
MSEKPNAAGLWDSLKGKFNLGPKKPVESMISPQPKPTSTEVLTSPAVEPQVLPAAELPDWLTPPDTAAPNAELPSPLDWLKQPIETRAPVPAVVEAPAPMAAVGTEKTPEQLAIGQFEEALLSADEALTRIRTGESLDETQLRAAKAAAAKANGVIRGLPENYLKVLLASRRLGENRDYTRMEFQKDMLAAIRVFSQTNKG